MFPEPFLNFNSIVPSSPILRIFVDKPPFIKRLLLSILKISSSLEPMIIGISPKKPIPK